MFYFYGSILYLTGDTSVLFAGDAEPNDVQIQSEPNWEDEDGIVHGLTCLCVVGIEDPVRDEVS